MNVMLSIKPEHCMKILSGEKTVELRKVVFKQKPERIYLYESSPIQKVVGYLDNYRVQRLGVWHLTFPDIMNDVCSRACVTVQQFVDYMGKSQVMNLIYLDRVVPIEPMMLSEFRIKHPPQNFCYIRKEMKCPEK